MTEVDQPKKERRLIGLARDLEGHMTKPTLPTPFERERFHQPSIIFRRLPSLCQLQKISIDEMATLNGPLPSTLTLLSSLKDFSPGQKVRFLGW